MRLSKKNFLIQVKYSDLASETRPIDKYFPGFGGELYLSPEETDNYNPAIINSVKSFAMSNNLPLRLHAPITDIDYAQLRSAISNLQFMYNKVFKLCRVLNIDSVVAHVEFNYNTEFPVARQSENAVSLWRVLCAGLGIHNIHLNIENHCEVEPDYLLGLMEKINSPYFGMCVDIGHANAFSDLGMRAWLKKYPVGSVKEVHLADNEGKGDSHLPLGKGNIDFTSFFEILAERDENPVFVLEPRNIDEVGESLFFLRKRGLIE